MSENERRERLWKFVFWAALIAGLWVFWRWALPALMPFLIGLVLARFVERPVRWLMARARMPRRLASLTMTIGLAAVIALLVYLILTRVMFETGRLLRQLPELMTRLPDMSSQLSDRFEAIIVAAPFEIQEFLRSSADRLLTEGVSIPSSLYAWLGGAATGFAGALPTAMLFMVALTLSMYLISSDYGRVAAFLMRQLPLKWRQRVLDSKDHMTSTLGKWLKAQGLLAALTSVQALAGMLLMRVDYALIITAIIAVLDLLPVVGSGMVFLPWGIFCLLAGDVGRGAGLLVLWTVITLVRGAAEPRLVGRQIGLHPLASLVCMYAGFRLMGVIGMLVLPMLAVLLVQLQEWGYVKLWKN